METPAGVKVQLSLSADSASNRERIRGSSRLGAWKAEEFRLEWLMGRRIPTSRTACCVSATRNETKDGFEAID